MSKVEGPRAPNTNRSRQDRRAGRPFDHSRDAEILSITLDMLAEHDYEHVSLDMIAIRSGRAKTTLYRRWPTKIDLVVAAVRAAGRPPEADELPEEGSLRADLLAVTDSPWLGGPERRLRIFVGLTSAAKSSEQLAEVVRTEVTQPYVEAYRALLQRAVDRGQLGADAQPKIASLAQVIPAMSTFGLNAVGEGVDRNYFVSVVDDIVLPALLHSRDDRPGPSRPKTAT